MKVVRLSAVCTDRLHPAENTPGTHFCQRLSQLQGHSATRRITSMENVKDSIGNQTCGLPTCSAVHQPTVPLCVQYFSNVISRLGVMLRSVYMWKENIVLDVLAIFKL
jgi:hypothetical protein